MSARGIAGTIGVGSLVVAAVLVGLVARPFASQSAAAPAQVGASAARGVVARPAQVTPSAARPHTVAAVANALTYEIGEQALTKQANALVAGRSIGQTPLGNATLHDLTVQLRNNQVTLSGTAQTDNARFPVQISAISHVQTGRVLVHVTDAQVGNFPAPEPVRRFIEQYLQTEIDQALAQSGAAVKSVEIGQGKLVIDLRPS
jgi:hypothetical protein